MPNPLAAVAAVMIAVSVAARALIAHRGYLAYDDFPILSMADRNDPTPDYLFRLFNNHFMPGGHLLSWLALRFGGFGYGPFLALLVAGQAAVSVAFYRLLRLMLPATWTLLVPLTVFLFTPLTLEAGTWWAVGVNVLPMQLAMVLAVGAQVKYVRTRRPLHLITLGLSILLGLLFFEKAILAVALVFLVTACLYGDGLWSTVRRWWPSWLVLTGVSLAFLGLYSALATSSVRRPSSVAEVLTFIGQAISHTLLPGLIGGPWAWFPAGDGAPIASPPPAARWTAIVITAAFVAYTIWRRRTTASRAWLLLVFYLALVLGLLGATRMGSVYSAVAGSVPRYIADVAVVAALAIGVALCGIQEREEKAAKIRMSPILLTGLAALLLSSAFTGIRYGDEWAKKAGRDYLANARADLATLPAGTVFMDQPVPEGVVGPLSAPYNRQSEFFAPLPEGPVFVTQGRDIRVFDQAGHVVKGWIDGPANRPGPRQGCGYRITGGPVRIPLTASTAEYWHVIRIAYLSDRDASATVRLGDGEPRGFDVHRGLNAMFVVVYGGGAEVVLESGDPAAGICTDEVAVGDLVPAPAN
ncbi:hypothetical protein [Actinoplanes sp. NBRC 101535]|uniref:hypothetical protein n=1 Tax=Actinoplanes sp. NBRC 101535 TaxID=3032196 RepID=UPI0024A538B2|nr:hypothetical protein [Actinoplanes sp. NBRC 101535]GLY02561.1 hypothetical protein Acsp01_29400 [Actinoplanes sp. NBRC 101535]